MTFVGQEEALSVDVAQHSPYPGVVLRFDILKKPGLPHCLLHQVVVQEEQLYANQDDTLCAEAACLCSPLLWLTAGFPGTSGRSHHDQGRVEAGPGPKPLSCLVC